MLIDSKRFLWYKLLVLTEHNPSFTLFSICSYFFTQSELRCSYKERSYKKECIYIRSDAATRDVLENFAKFRGKHLYRSLCRPQTQMFSCEFCEIFKNNFGGCVCPNNTFSTEHRRVTASVRSNFCHLQVRTLQSK